MIVTPQETFLNLEEAAQALACDPETVRALAAKLRSLTYAQEVALVDAVEQWWRSVTQDITEG